MDAGATVGFFGKLPCRGDFLRRRVSDEFVAAWDEWLQQCLTRSREQLRDPWRDAYLSGPIWRFVLSEGVCGTGAYAGVLMPSVDRVGRCFPMTIVTQWPDSACAIDVACGARAWFEAVEEIAADGLEIGDLDAFDAQVSRAGSLMRSNGVDEAADLRQLIARSEFPQRGGQWHVPLLSVHSLQRAVNALAARELERTMRPLSIWWSDGSDDVGAAWLCVRGLPAAQSFGSMLTGHWNGAGWNSAAPPAFRFAREAVSATSAMGATGVRGTMGSTGTMVSMGPIGSRDAETRSSPSIRVLAQHVASSAQRHFVLRPEIGLWAVVAAESAQAESVAAAQMLADALYEVPVFGSLTVGVERLRETLESVQRQLARNTNSGAPLSPLRIGVVSFIGRGEECAVVFTGPVQVARSTDAGLEPIPLNDNPELLDLVMGRSAGADGIGVRYEALSAARRWVLAACGRLEDSDALVLNVEQE